jgi:hypothetical protein
MRWLFLLAPFVAACTLGNETPPGCRTDHPEDCDPGWVCRAGACFAYTTGASPPVTSDAAADSSEETDAEADANDASADAAAQADAPIE